PLTANDSACARSAGHPSSEPARARSAHVRQTIENNPSPHGKPPEESAHHIRGTTGYQRPATRRLRARHPYLLPLVRSPSRTIADAPCGRPVDDPVTASAACPSLPLPNLALAPLHTSRSRCCVDRLSLGNTPRPATVGAR